MADSEFSPVSPGEILKEEFLAAYKLTQADLARATAQSLERTRNTVLGNWGIGRSNPSSSASCMCDRDDP